MLRKWFQHSGRVNLAIIAEYIDAYDTFKAEVKAFSVPHTEWQLTHLNHCTADRGSCGCLPEPEGPGSSPTLKDYKTGETKACSFSESRSEEALYNILRHHAGSYILITTLSGSFAEQGSKAVGTAVVPFLFIFFGGYSIAFTPITTAYWTEIWPFALRARGVALGSMTVYSALLFNLFVNPIALAAIAWKYYIVFICVLIVAMITIYFTYPETRGFTLEEMVIVFDGNDAHVSEIPEGKEKERSDEGAKPLYAHEEKVAKRQKALSSPRVMNAIGTYIKSRKGSDLALVL
ncbi:hypothetical protein V501_00171 [Pseudogymnoascus sp. VKM F-4519 (FW-2642)]|nr:hypothetical protein V501_00171 [Pseudogymnoascus sp. VKM F-4519 (FW-2642)]